MAWEIGRAGDADARDRFRAVVGARRRGPGGRRLPEHRLRTAGPAGRAGRDLEWGHELYCLGHLFQAAVARRRTRPDADDGLLEIARRAADLVCDVVRRRTGIESVCGHPEIETALVELGRVTGEPRYLDAGGPVRRASRARRARATSSGAAPTSRTTCRCGRRRSCAVTPCAPTTCPPVPSTSPSSTGDDELLDALATAVGEHRRAAHVHHRRSGLAPPGRGVRRRLGAAAGPRLLRDLRRRRLGDVLLAAAARPRRRRSTPT